MTGLQKKKKKKHMRKNSMSQLSLVYIGELIGDVNAVLESSTC